MLGVSRLSPRSTATLRGLILAGACAALSSCSDAASTEPAPAPGTTRLLLGTGERAYAPIEGEPVLPLIAGIQGGFHVWASFLGYGYQGDRLRMQVTTSWGPDEEHTFASLEAPIRVHEVVDDGGETAVEGNGWPARIELAPCAQGQLVTIAMTVRDDFGATASDSRRFVAEVQEELRGTDCPAR